MALVTAQPGRQRPRCAAEVPAQIQLADRGEELRHGARAAFSYGATNWFPAQLGHWMAAHQAPAASITDGLIFMAVAVLLTRTIGMTAQAARIRPDAVAAPRVAVGS
ncbi:MAG TPA: hypothetical protein VGX23_07255 [Actinocrinis sp.]|nr:hypothetical protein [Actinocrinis sp.]